jgi:hypothetical protein
LPWPLFHPNNFAFSFLFLYLIYLPRSHTEWEFSRLDNW